MLRTASRPKAVKHLIDWIHSLLYSEGAGRSPLPVDASLFVMKFFNDGLGKKIEVATNIAIIFAVTLIGVKILKPEWLSQEKPAAPPPASISVGNHNFIHLELFVVNGGKGIDFIQDDFHTLVSGSMQQ